MQTIYQNIPNYMSGFPLVVITFLLIIAWLNRPKLFFALLAVFLISDALDGLVALRLRVTSETGAKLDRGGRMKRVCLAILLVGLLSVQSYSETELSTPAGVKATEGRYSDAIIISRDPVQGATGIDTAAYDSYWEPHVTLYASSEILVF